MKPSKISYSESKESVNEIGLKSWRKAGMEAELQDGDIYLDCFDELKKEISYVLNGHPPMIRKEGEPIEPTYQFFNQPLPTIDTQKEKIEIAIDNCESLYELDLLMGDIAKHGLVPQFLEKKKSLK